MEVKVVGDPCGYHGPYTFYKGIRISPASSTSIAYLTANGAAFAKYMEVIDPKTAELFRNNDTIIKSIIKDEYDSDSSADCVPNSKVTTSTISRKFHAVDVKPKVGNGLRKSITLALGDCIPVRPWSDSPIACVAELRMVWRDKSEQCLLTALRLYFLPENTPMGRNCHGEDEVLAISDRVVIRADDLLNWFDDTINWTYGIRATTMTKSPTVKEEEGSKEKSNPGKPSSDTIKTECNNSVAELSPHVRSLRNSKLDFSEVEKEKVETSRTNVAVISYPRYCRYRATLKRLENVGDEWLRNTLVQALCGFVSYGPDTRVMFCKETFDYPELETHELLCNHLAPKLKGRPRGRRKKIRSDSPSSRIRCDSAGSDSCTSEISACSVEKVYSKYSPLYVKPEFKQGKQVLATRPQLRYNPRPARTKLKSESSTTRSRRMQHNRGSSDSNSDSNDSDTNTNTTNRDDDDNESSEESEFVQKLMDFHDAQDSQIPKVFWDSLKRINLLSIYQKVKKMGGYDQVIEQKMWKYLFGLDGGYNTISRKKYERLLLPYEKYEMRTENANHAALRRGRSSYDYKYDHDDEADSISGEIKGEPLDMSEMEGAARRKQKDVHVEMGSGSLPLTLIVGNKKSALSPSFHIQQPHTTITVHRTTIHPQTLSQSTPPNNQIHVTNQIQIQQITVQPKASTSRKQDDPSSADQKYMYNIKQDANSYEVQIEPSKYNNYAKLGSATSLRHVRVKSDRSKDNSRKSSIMPLSHQMPQSSIGAVTVSAIKPYEKENIPYLAGSKTTTITPILGNSNKSTMRYPASISEIIDLVDSDNESSDSAQSPHAHQNSSMFPNMKKRKLDILRQGGLEVTAISNSAGPLNNQPSYHGVSPSGAPLINVPPVNVAKITNNSKMNPSLTAPHISVPWPRFQSRCMFMKTSRIFGNPKDLIPLPVPKPTEFNCIDLSVERCDRPPPIELLRLPQSTTIQKAHSSAVSALDSSVALAAQKITDPNLQITLVKPMTHVQLVHNSQNHNIKRKSTEPSKNHIPEKKISLPSSTRISSYHSTTSKANTPPATNSSPILNVPSLTSLNDLKINQLLLQNFLNQGTSAAVASVSNPQSNQPSKEPCSSPSPASNPFLPMLDPMYLSGIYGNPNLFQSQNPFFQQTLPQEILQLYKNFPQGLGIIPISKS